MSFSAFRAVGDRESERKWPSCWRGLCLPQLYPSSFSFVVREQWSGFAAAATTAFPTTMCCSETNLDLAGASSRSSRLTVQNVFRWTCHCKLWVTSYKFHSNLFQTVGCFADYQTIYDNATQRHGTRPLSVYYHKQNWCSICSLYHRHRLLSLQPAIFISSPLFFHCLP